MIQAEVELPEIIAAEDVERAELHFLITLARMQCIEVRDAIDGRWAGAALAARRSLEESLVLSPSSYQKGTSPGDRKTLPRRCLFQPGTLKFPAID